MVGHLEQEILQCRRHRSGWAAGCRALRQCQLTDDDLARAKGRCDVLIGIIRERYGIAKGEVDRQLREWEDRQSA